jgi:dihydrofolate synthase/folylpolyglutamate synthase
MNIEIEYQSALDYLYSFIDYSLTRSFRYTPDKFNLDRMVKLMDQLGNPQNCYPIIHVAGTKGKGSVSAMCASVLRAAGYSTGFYSSPHLSQYTERIQVNGVEIPRDDFVNLINEIKPIVAGIPQLTTFELTTAIAFLYYARVKVDVVVLEVGLGGRLDATNIIDPMVSVITSLSYDHMNVLGDTLALIAGEKAGIIKPGHPIVSAPQKDEARLVLEETAKERSSPFIQVGTDYLYEPLAHSLEKQSLLVWKLDEEPVQLSLPLLGKHQVENAATAYAALQTASQAGLKLNDRDIKLGFEKVYWPGRFEVLRHNPPVIIDSAHNRDSAMRLRQALDDYIPEIPVIMVFGASEDKDIDGMFSELLPRVSTVITTHSIHPRAMSADDLAGLARKFDWMVHVAGPVEEALSQALKLAGQKSAVVVAGSLFVAAAAREIWLKQGAAQMLLPDEIVERVQGKKNNEK